MLARLPLADDSGLGLLLLDLVGVDPVEEILAALGVLHVLNAHGDPLGQDLALDPLVDDHAHRVLGHVEHAARLPVVGLVGHALLEGATACTARKLNVKTRIRRSKTFINRLGIRIRRFKSLPDPDPLLRGTYPDPSIFS